MRQFLTTFFLGVCAFFGGVAAVQLSTRGVLPVFAQNTSTSPTTNASDVGRLSERFESVARKVSPTVVSIDAVKPATKSSTKSKSIEESGSGVLIRIAAQRGVFVLTNNHVIQQAPPAQINVTLADSHIFKAAQVWADPETDVALLRLDGADNLPTASLGDSDTVRVGHWVLAFGSPFGLNQTVTHGIISARERGQISLGTTIRIKDFLQTDAAINPGSSGGPLVNLDGDVIGINTAIASQSGGASGVAFSIPINLVKTVVKQLIEKGSVTRGYLGLQVAGSFEAADAAKLGLDKAQGALVEVVYPDTPAATAGIKPKDVVLEIDGVVIRNENHFINLISELPAGKKIRLQVWRDQRTMSVEAEVGDWSKAQSRFKTTP
jgi:S1-C subfamily serine protease